MAISSLRGLSPEEKKQAMLRISQFILREPSANVRESLYRRLLEIGIYLLGKNGKRELDDILNIIKIQFFGVKLEKEIAERYLQQLEKEGAVRLEYGEYFLSEKRISQIENYSKYALSLVSSCEANFIETIKRKMGNDISEEDSRILRECFYQFILHLVSRHIVNTARLLVKGTIEHIPLSSGENLVDISLSEINNAELREAAKITLIEMMRFPNEEFIQYLFYMRQNFLCLEVLNLDPDCRRLEREEFSKKRLFLDTNVLLSLVLQNEFHIQTKKLIENTQRLGCSIYVTKRTLKEFNVVLDKARESLKKLKATPYQLSKVSNMFIRTYGKVLLDGGCSLSTSDFINQFSDMENLLKSLGIRVFDEEHEEIKELPEFKGLVEEVSRCFEKLRWRKKTEEVAEHDAFHLLLTKTLRGSENSSILGPDVWFLSNDLTLSCSDKFINTKFKFSDNTSPVMITSVWNEVISPFLIGIITEKDLVEVLKSFISSEFAPISEDIDAEILAKLEVDWTEYDWLETEEIKEIINQKFILDYISRREELAKTGDNEAIEQSRSEFNIAFTKMIGQISNRKIEQVRIKLEEKDRETEELKVSVKNLEKTKNELQESLTSEQILTLRMRYVTGIAGICSLVIGAVLIVLMGNSASLQLTGAYITFLVIGVILLLMSIAPGQVSAILGLGRNK